MKPMPIKQADNLLKKSGYTPLPGKGSHIVYRKPGVPCVSIPNNRVISPGVARQIVNATKK
jgi:predicted RNA binding protein YcfA (HicA-like mRNA interferase family)